MLKNINFIKKHFKSQVSDLEDRFSAIKGVSKGRVAAVDGGAAIIIDGGSWVLAKLRAACITYERNKVSEQKDDYYFTLIKGDDYRPFINPDFKLSNDWTGLRDLNEAPSLLMKAVEFNKGSLAVREKPDLLLMDSLLIGETKDQDDCLKKLEHESRVNKVDVVGLAKTCRLSINGHSIIGSLLRKRPKGSWLYPLEDKGSFIVKLHDKAKHCYMINLFSHSLNNLDKILSLMSYYSKDAELLGYPYPLLKADKVARVNDYEKKREYAKFKLMIKKQGLDVEADERSTDMHSFLDKRFWRQ